MNTQILVEIAKEHELTYLALFGSYARNQAKPQSDVDLYARFGRPVGLFEVLAVKHAMEDAIRLKVDLIVEEAVILHQFIRDGMAKELIVLYEDERKASGWVETFLEAPSFEEGARRKL